MGLTRLELVTSPLSGVRSNHLSYRPVFSISLPRHGAIRLAPDRHPTRLRFDQRIQPLKTEPERHVKSEDSPRVDRSIFLVKRLENLLLRKEVIQPQVPLRLPCYDFTPVIDHSLGTCFLAVSSATSGAINSHGVTGGVYKARERIHRCLLISDY